MPMSGNKVANDCLMQLWRYGQSALKQGGTQYISLSDTVDIFNKMKDEIERLEKQIKAN